MNCLGQHILGVPRLGDRFVCNGSPLAGVLTPLEVLCLLIMGNEPPCVLG